MHNARSILDIGRGTPRRGPWGPQAGLSQRRPVGGRQRPGAAGRGGWAGGRPPGSAVGGGRAELLARSQSRGAVRSLDACWNRPRCRCGSALMCLYSLLLPQQKQH